MSVIVVMRYLCSNYVFSIVISSIFCHAECQSDSDVRIPEQYFHQRYDYSNSYPQRSQPLSVSQARSTRGIPIDLAMKLNTITDERELFEQFIENGAEILSSSFVSNGRANRHFSDADSYGTGTGARVGRVADSRNYESSQDTEIEAHQQFGYRHTYTAPSANSRINNRQQSLAITSRVGGNDENTDESPPKVFVSESSLPPKIPRPAICEPESRTVSLKDIDDPTFFYYPSCTRVKRCGGCCAHDLLSCQPKTLQYTNYTVNLSKYNGKDKLTYFGKKVITVEEHLNCSCQCKIKSTDCSPQQRYEKQNCRCVCKNTENEAKCTKEHTIKLWNPSTCSCQCRDRSECSSGYYFDRSICRCIPNQKPNLLPDYNIDRTEFASNYEPPY